ncbi:MAG TPA: branched-chain amino acid ABC transporter permease [Casimicrobiaceae bacterium]|jgi:branched-chain amino acid transport system permease protein|nr:branched-chain amino acid ABC transporter permease [Casimicrobiaceae bacterium]
MTIVDSFASRFVPLVVACALLAAFPFVGGKFYVDLMLTTMIFAIFALSLELLVGRTGLVSFGHAAFFGIAAYVTTLLSPQSEAPSVLWLLPVVLVVTALAALAIGALSLRTRGIYFIMVTLAFAQMAYFVFHDMKFAGGSDGRYLYVKPVLAVGPYTLVDFDRPLTFYFATLALLVLVYALLAAIGRSRFGHALSGIKANEQRMRAAGFSTYPYKLAAFVLAGALAGVAGFLYAVKDGYVNPEILAWHQSGTVLLMLILGGIGSLRGAVVGAFLFVVLKELFQSEALFGGFAKHWQLPLGLTIIACVALMPNGIIGLPSLLRRTRGPVPHAG